MKEASKKYRFLYVIVVVFGLISAFFMSRFSISLGKLIDVVIEPDGSLVMAMGLCVAMLLCWLIISFFYDYAEISYINKVVRYVKENLYKAFYEKELNSFFEVKNGDYLSLYSKDVDLLVDNYLIPKCDMVCNLLSASVCLISIFIINWKLGCSYVVISLITVVLSQLPGTIMAKMTEEYTFANKKYMSLLENNLNGFEQIRLLDVGKYFLKNIDLKDKEYEKSRKRYLFARIGAGDLGKSFGMLSQLLCMVVGIFLALNGNITVGMMIAAVQLLNGVFSPLQLFVQDKNLLGTTEEIIKRIEDNQKNEVRRENHFSEQIEKIAINNLNLKFGQKAIFTDYSTCFSSGKKYAIVGESGKGKSSLIKVLMKYVKENDYQGNISINNRELSTINSKDLYRKVGYVQRNSFLIDGTVKDNIKLYRDEVSDERLDTVCEALNLENDLVNKRVDTSNPNEVSFGEKQRIDIARFLVKDYDVLIFDEPTSNLDPQTSSEIFESILKITNRIVIVITHEHNKELLSRFDEVITIG